MKNDQHYMWAKWMIELRKYIYTIIMTCIVLFLSGCASQDLEKTETKEHTEELIPVGRFTSLPVELANTAWLYANQADLFYWEIQWDVTDKVLISRIHKWKADEDLPQLILENKNPDDTIYTVFADEEGNIYLFGSLAENGIIQYYMKKISTDGNLVWQVIMDYDTMGVLEGQDMLGGVADRKGQICLYDRLGKLFLFDEKGQLKKKMDSPSGPVDGMVCAGEKEIIGYYFKREAGETYKSLEYFIVDPETGTTGSGKNCSFDKGFDVETVWGGRENQIYVIADNFLYEIALESGNRKKMLALDEKYVNIEGSEIQTMSVLESGQPVLYLYDAISRVLECAIITYHKTDTLPEKETVTFGTRVNYDTERLAYYIRRFNRQSEHWRVEVVDYFAEWSEGSSMVDSFTMDVLNGKGPDLIDTGIVPEELLYRVELYENLEPYFASSKIVNREDIMDSVWRAGSHKDGMYFVMPWFTILSYAVKTDRLDGSLWNPETFIRLADQYQDSNVLNYMTGTDRGSVLLNYALKANRKLFYDIENRNCFFTKPQFLSLLEGIKRIKENGTAVAAMDTIEQERQFREDEILIYQEKIDSMTLYQKFHKSFGNTASWVGYPSSGESSHMFYVHVMLSINSSSRYKDGAWEFLEFLLSEEAQRWKEQDFRAFPVRKDGFDYYIRTTPLIGPGWSYEEYASEEELHQLYQMVENTHMVPDGGDQVNSIIVEECMAYFHGDRSAEETAEVIQSRVGLYFDERAD